MGEYIGRASHEHMVKYSRVSLIFYAVVDNSSHEPCWPCEQAWALFSLCGLDKVPISSLGTFRNYDKLCDAVEEAFHTVAGKTLSEQEEGSVLYFI